MRKVALFAFNGEMTCFVHALLNALDLRAQGHEVALVVEGTATQLAPRFGGGQGPFAGLFEKVRQQGLLAGICRACAVKMDTLAEVERLGLPVLDDMSGHAGMAPFIQRGFEIITFG
ncbi:MAG: cytoplasmic protein [Pseudomonadota bacterium]